MGQKYIAVLDTFGRKVNGIWRRNNFFYGSVYVPEKHCSKKIRLVSDEGTPARNVREAISQREAIIRRIKRNLFYGAPVSTPLFGQYAQRYLEYSRGVKDEQTVMNESSALRRMVAFFGANIRLAQISRARLNDFVRFRRDCGVTASTINVDVAILSRMLRFAKQEGVTGNVLATDDWKPLRHVKKEQRLYTPEEIDRIVAEARTPGKYRWGEETADWVLLMAYSGARHHAALSVQWCDVDFTNRRLTLRRNQKFDRVVFVDFNDRLEAHLKDMLSRKKTFVKHLFPYGPVDFMASLDNTLVEVRAAAGIPDFRPHGLRHFFISWCVMSGVDFMTIAHWVGHKDGGVLIGKVYGHLNNAHQKRAASLVRFGIAEGASGLGTGLPQCPTPSAPSSP